MTRNSERCIKKIGQVDNYEMALLPLIDSAAMQVAAIKMENNCGTVWVELPQLKGLRNQ